MERDENTYNLMEDLDELDKWADSPKILDDNDEITTIPETQADTIIISDDEEDKCCPGPGDHARSKFEESGIKEIKGWWFHGWPNKQVRYEKYNDRLKMKLYLDPKTKVNDKLEMVINLTDNQHQSETIAEPHSRYCDDVR